jgi:hypothetical protein
VLDLVLLRLCLFTFVFSLIDVCNRTLGKRALVVTMRWRSIASVFHRSSGLLAMSVVTGFLYLRTRSSLVNVLDRTLLSRFVALH